MIRFACLAVVGALLTAPLHAEPITIPGERLGYGIPPGFVIRDTGMDFNEDFTYIWVAAEGNCRWEYRQVCYPTGNGGVVCRDEREWKCDRATDTFKMPPSFTVDTDAKRAYFTPEGGDAITYGKIKSFLWSKWIGLFEGADLQVDYDGAAVVLDPEVLGTSLKKDNFQELYQGEAE